MRAAWRTYLVVGVAVSVGLLALPTGALRDSAIAAVGLSAAVAVVVAIRVRRLERAPAWWLVAAALTAWAVGDWLWVWFDHGLGVEPFPSGADVAYLTGYPLAALALYLLARRRTGGADRSALLDSLIVAVGVTLVLYVLFIEPTWTTAEGTLVERVIAVAYPVADVVLLTQLAHLATARSRRSPTVVLLAAGAGVMLVADLLFRVGAYVEHLDVAPDVVDPLWAASYVLWGAAVLHPDTPRLARTEPPTRYVLTARRIAALGGAVLVLPTVVTVEEALGLQAHTMETSAAGVAVVALVLLRLLGLVRQINEQAARLERHASTDPVTGLANPRRLHHALTARLRAADDGVHTAVVLVAVERFGEVHEALGLETGEELLTAVGRRLVDVAGRDAAVGRLGGARFVVVLSGLPSAEVAANRAQELRRAFDGPVDLARLEVSVEVVVGLAVGPDDARTAPELFRCADAARSAAREQGHRFARFADVSAAEVSTAGLMTELTDAIAAGDVVVHFQPQVEIATGRVLGLEALVRWQHPRLGMVPPSAFVTAAERTGLIHALTAHVLDRSLREAARWHEAGRDLVVSVNLSARNLLDPHFVEEVRAALDRHRVPAARLELEITETIAMVDPAGSVAVLDRLAALGVTLSVDDYGTGHSSLAYLQRLPVHRLKIDRSFVARLVDEPASAVIVRSTVELARSLGLSTVAEGVEDDGVLRALHEMGCWAAQGFGLARPVPADEVLEVVARLETAVPDMLHPVPAPRSGT